MSGWWKPWDVPGIICPVCGLLLRFFFYGLMVEGVNSLLLDAERSILSMLIADEQKASGSQEWRGSHVPLSDVEEGLVCSSKPVLHPWSHRKETTTLMSLSLGHWHIYRLEHAIHLTLIGTWGWTWSSSWTWTLLIPPTSWMERTRQRKWRFRLTSWRAELLISSYIWHEYLVLTLKPKPDYLEQQSEHLKLFPLGKLYMVFRGKTSFCGFSHLWCLRSKPCIKPKYLGEFANLICLVGHIDSWNRLIDRIE